MRTPEGYERLRERRRARHEEAIAFLGGKCGRCESMQDLEFDHIDPSTKLFKIGSAMMVADERFWAEVRKCQLLCSPCHRRKSIDESGVTVFSPGVRHGSRYGYQKLKCRCDDCRKWASDRWARQKAARTPH